MTRSFKFASSICLMLTWYDILAVAAFRLFVGFDIATGLYPSNQLFYKSEGVISTQACVIVSTSNLSHVASSCPRACKGFANGSALGSTLGGIGKSMVLWSPRAFEGFCEVDWKPQRGSLIIGRLCSLILGRLCSPWCCSTVVPVWLTGKTTTFPPKLPRLRVATSLPVRSV